MAQIENPQKSYMFSILAAGLNPYAVQEANIPDFEFDSVEHGDVDYDAKTAGRRKYGNIKLVKLVPLGIGDNWIWNWIQLIRNRNGGGAVPSIYKRNIDIVQYHYDLVTITDMWAVKKCWPVKVNGRELSRTKSENTMDDIELSVDTYEKTR